MFNLSGVQKKKQLIVAFKSTEVWGQFYLYLDIKKSVKQVVTMFNENLTLVLNVLTEIQTHLHLGPYMIDRYNEI